MGTWKGADAGKRRGRQVPRRLHLGLGPQAPGRSHASTRLSLPHVPMASLRSDFLSGNELKPHAFPDLGHNQGLTGEN